MKTPSPQEAAKYAEKEANNLAVDSRSSISCVELANRIEASLLEADKNGYERGQEDRDDISRRLDKKLCKAILREMEDDALLLEVHEMLILGDCVCTPGNGCVRCALLKKVESRLAPRA